jgi:hypothetical protein
MVLAITGGLTFADNPGKGFLITTNMNQYLLVKFPAGVLTLCALDTNNDWIGCTLEPRQAPSAPLAQVSIPVRFRHAGTMPGVTADATPIAAGALVYKGAAGTLTATSTGSVAVGIALIAVTGAGLYFEYMPY